MWVGMKAGEGGSTLSTPTLHTLHHAPPCMTSCTGNTSSLVTLDAGSDGGMGVDASDEDRDGDRRGAVTATEAATESVGLDASTGTGTGSRPKLIVRAGGFSDAEPPASDSIGMIHLRASTRTAGAVDLMY